MENKKSWIGEIKKNYKIKYINKNTFYNLIKSKKCLWATRCCKTKLCKIGSPVEMYDSYITKYFYCFVLHKNLPFAIISDKYGLHFYDEELPYYNTHPSSLTIRDKKILGKKIYKKIKPRGFTTIVFYNNSPLLSKPYFEILSHSGLEIFFTTKLFND